MMSHNEIEEYLTQQQELLLAMAVEICDRFYQEREIQHQKAKSTGNYKLMGSIGCRAKIQPRGGRGIVCEWFRQKYVGEKGNRRAFSQTIKKGRTTNTYARSKVIGPDSPEWEGRMFDLLEPEFERIRAASKALGKLSRQYGEFRKKILVVEEATNRL